ncbi:MAG: hypothetical protein LBE59_10770, partial [Nevskiaceae bacterium]|nr:hypothetical protein [Nevskiaceae bacterium]
VGSAQEGFPLDGTWRAKAVAADGSERTLVLVMQWDGKQVAGLINPGRNGISFTGGTLEPQGWKFTLNAKDAGGADVRFEGTIGDLGKVDRWVEGQWTEGGRSQTVRFVRE